MSTSRQVLRLGDLRRRFLDWQAREVAAGRARPRTLAYYRDQLEPFVRHAGAALAVAELVPWHLEECKTGWHSVQAVQRLFNWGTRMGLVGFNPFAQVERPPPGRRRRVLDRGELARLLRCCPRPFRRFLIALRRTMARPQELRSLVWGQLEASGRAFVLDDFKGKRRRRDGVELRVIALDGYTSRLLLRLRRGAGPAAPVFVNRRGQAWTSNALRLAMRRARRRAGLDAGGELVVCYTLRHSGATEATAAGVGDRQLADLLGHASTRTTARYQHLRIGHLVEAIDRATARRRPA